MTDQHIADRHIANGKSSGNSGLKGRKKQWKDLTIDPLAEGFDSHQAEYVVGKSPLPGQL